MKGSEPMKKQRIIRSILVAELLLLVPLIGMQFSDEWGWNLFDFIIASILLAGIGISFELMTSGIKSNPKLTVAGVILTLLMLLTWAELAVGLFGIPFAGS